MQFFLYFCFITLQQIKIMIDCSHTTEDRWSYSINHNIRKVSKAKLGLLLNRVLLKTKQEAYRQLKLNVVRKRKNINLPLLLTKFKRNIYAAFYMIRFSTILTQQHKMSVLVETKRNPQVIANIWSEWVKKKKNQGFQSLKQYNIKINSFKKDIRILQIIFKKLVKERAKIMFDKIRGKVIHLQLQKKLINSIQRIETKALIKLKRQAFNKMVFSILKQNVSETVELKKAKLKEMVDLKNDSIKCISSAKEELKSLQHSLSSQSYEINRSKTQLKRQTKANKTKLDQEIKITEKQIQKNNFATEMLLKQLSEKQSQQMRRQKSLKNSHNSFQNIKLVYESIMSHPNEQFRSINSLKQYINVCLPIKQIEEFHIYENLKIRHVVKVYQKNQFTVKTPEYQQAMAENQKLRSIIKLINIKEFDTQRTEEK